MPNGNQSDVVIGFNELAHALARPAHALRAAHGIDLLPLRSEMRSGTRCFDGDDVALLADALRSKGAS